MIIAAHIRQTNGTASFLLPLISQIASEQQSIQFILFCVDPEALGELPANCKRVPIKRSLKNILLLHYWFQYTLPTLLKKFGATLFISENSVCSLRTAVVHIMVVRENFTVTSPTVTAMQVRYFKKYFPAFADKAAQLCVTSPFLTTILNSCYPHLENKTVEILHGLNNDYKPLNELEQTTILDHHTEGFNYFVCECSASSRPHMVTLVKAFSLFKKRLKSSLQLVIINKLRENPVPDFHLYKYRQEVKVVNDLTPKNEAELIAAAYAAIEISSTQTEHDWGLQCMRCRVPLVTVNSDVARKQYADAAIFTELNEIALAEKLMLLYKDESFRNAQIEMGNTLVSPYTWEHCSRLLWQRILQCS